MEYYYDGTTTSEAPVPISSDNPDSAWILLTTFVILFMQMGFGLLESGSSSHKNSVSILMNKVVLILLNGLTYWIVGYGLHHGMDTGSNQFIGVGYFFVATDLLDIGSRFLHFVYQFTFFTVSCSIVTGSILERFNFKAFSVFYTLFFIIYCPPAGWLWRSNGWLNKIGSVDFCGTICVHLLGGTSALIAAWKLGPRKGIFDIKDEVEDTKNPVISLIGYFVLW